MIFKIKKAVVEEDEKETGIRKILNFGHTFGHGVESKEGMSRYYHGECVAIGMLPMCSREVRSRLVPVLDRLGLPSTYTGELEEALAFLTHDKKRQDKGIDVILVERVGECKIVNMSYEEISERVKNCYK